MATLAAIERRLTRLERRRPTVWLTRSGEPPTLTPEKTRTVWAMLLEAGAFTPEALGTERYSALKAALDTSRQEAHNCECVQP